MSTAKDLVLARLRKDKVKLWLPPYRDLPTQGGGANRDALEKLAASLQTTLAKEQRNITTGEIIDILSELQDHAVQKLKDKQSVTIKILASSRHFVAAASSNQGGDGAGGGLTDVAQRFSAWGDEVSIIGGGSGKSRPSAGGKSFGNNVVLRVVNVSSALTIGAFSDDVCRVLDATTARIIWKGKNLPSSGTLRDIVLGGKTGSVGKSELLCIVSGLGYVPPAPSVAAVAAAVSAASPLANGAPPERSDAEVIESIRRAANAIQNSSGGSRFEVTDQNGNLVAMKRSDTVAFLTTLGLHRIGRSKLEQMKNGPPEPSEESTWRDGVASALVFLLEADAAWNNTPALDDWKSKVDNYGLLQLDISWCYLLLESLEDLTDAVERLDIAETVLKRQVHSNFVALALNSAEMNNPIPPLCAVFVRLFLLQGVAKKMQNCNASSAERLEWAQMLCNRLRSSCPPDTVQLLCNAYFVEPSTAIAALRRSNGDPDAAGNFISQDRDEEKIASKKRRRQHRIGKCANGTDFVDLDLIAPLSEMLFGTENVGDEHSSTSASIVIGLLRLSNNVLDGALERFNSTPADSILQEVDRLDEASGRRKRKPKSAEAQTKPSGCAAQDVDLAVLVSMGVEEERGREALRATGNVESALLWLSRNDAGGCNLSGTEKVSGEAVSAKESADGERKPGTSGSGNGDKRGTSESEEENGTTESDESESEESDVADAFELLERELGNALGTESKQLLEKEWFGADLSEEWSLIKKYIE